jgi:hypothetical protein
MSFGSGTPLWGRNGESLSSHQQQQQASGNTLSYRSNSPSTSNNHNNMASGSSYQASANASYQPPKVGGTYADQQTGVMMDTMKTNYETDAVAAEVLTQMNTQRHQLQGAHNNVHEMREATENAKRELQTLQGKMRAKKRRLQFIVVGLGSLDFFLFLRLMYCGGSFFCRRRW